MSHLFHFLAVETHSQNSTSYNSPSYLEVIERHFPHVGSVFGRPGCELGITGVADRLATVRVLGGRVDGAAGVEGGLLVVVLQDDLVQCEPAAGGYRVVSLAHGEARREERGS